MSSKNSCFSCIFIKYFEIFSKNACVLPYILKEMVKMRAFLPDILKNPIKCKQALPKFSKKNSSEIFYMVNWIFQQIQENHDVFCIFFFNSIVYISSFFSSEDHTGRLFLGIMTELQKGLV